jgi:hypothetical protein
MRYAIDYRIICQPENSKTIAITIPSGEASIQRVRKDATNNAGLVDLYEVSLNTFLKIQPKDRLLRNAWKINSTGIIEDVSLSKELIKERRNAALNYLDTLWLKEYRKPMGNPKLADKVAQALRDIPKTEAFLSSDINSIRGLMYYINNILKSESIDSGLLPQYINDSLFIKDDRASFMSKLFSKLLSNKLANKEACYANG